MAGLTSNSEHCYAQRHWFHYLGRIGSLWGEWGAHRRGVGGNGHLPHHDELPTLPVGIQRVRGSGTSVAVRSNAQSSTLNRPMFSQWRVKETVAQLTWTQLSPVN